MAAAVFGLTACVPGVISWGVAELVCKRRDEQCKKICDSFNQKVQNFQKQWKLHHWEALIEDEGEKPNLKNLSDLIPLCPHKKENEADDCSVKTCNDLREDMQSEMSLFNRNFKNHATVSENRPLLISIITAVAMTALTSAFIIPLCPLLTTIHL
ncbi:MAG: hypothetical protein Q8L98_01580 [Chlamydiales bacterium]|nr:hypothetical protein [Chlamydiales bacterium]